MVRPRPVLDGIRDVNILAPNVNLAEHTVQEYSGDTDERLAQLVLEFARSLPDKHQVGVVSADAEDEVRPFPQRALPAGPGSVFYLSQGAVSQGGALLELRI